MMKKITNFTLSSIFAFTLIFQAEAQKLPNEAQKLPNIVFYMADDQTQADGLVYGAEVLKTPTAKKLSEAGLTFDNAFVASPSCAPSRGALFTGLMPAKNGAECNHTFPNHGTLILTQKLQESGYKILGFGKTFHKSKDKDMSEEMKKERKLDFYSKPRINLYDNVSDYFKNNNPYQPVCLMVGDRRPHVPWTTENIYDPDELKLPSFFIDTKETRQHWVQYYSDITGLDDEMGKIYKLAQEKFGDNFIFIYSSDHGAQWPFHKWNLYDAGIKTPLIIVWPDHIQPNTRTEAMVSWIDIFPTLLDITDSEIPVNLDGKSFKDVIEGRTHNHRDYIFTTHTGDGQMNVYPIRSVRDKQFKYILNLRPNRYHSNHSDILRRPNSDAYWYSWDEAAKSDIRAAAIIQKYYVRPAEEFYDIQNNPNEQINFIHSEEHQEKIQKMRFLLDEWMKEQGERKDVYETPYPADGPKPYEIYRRYN
jgi:N-sulfoglucosamine sulfohydrolase